MAKRAVYESNDGFPKPAADGFPLCGNALPRKAGNDNLSFGFLDGISEVHKIGFPKPAAYGFPLCRDALSRKAGSVILGAR
jgi:hypothetical protein